MSGGIFKKLPTPVRDSDLILTFFRLSRRVLRFRFNQKTLENVRFLDSACIGGLHLSDWLSPPRRNDWADVTTRARHQRARSPASVAVISRLLARWRLLSNCCSDYDYWGFKLTWILIKNVFRRTVAASVLRFPLHLHCLWFNLCSPRVCRVTTKFWAKANCPSSP